jgi:hypothetical protein
MAGNLKSVGGRVAGVRCAGRGRAYLCRRQAGAWDTDNLENVVTLFLINHGVLPRYVGGSLVRRLLLMLHNKFVRANSLAGSRRSIEAHYDVGNDRNWQYDLNICAAVFQVGRTDVAQVELVHA